MDSVLGENTMKWICVAICTISCITGTVLIIFGFSSLEATEYGLDYSWLSKTINPGVKENGLYFLGIGHSFIKFPKNVQTIEFSKDSTSNRKPIESRTYDGLEVTLEISFQYVLQPDKLYDLYNKFGPQYNKIFQNIAIDILTEEATKYTAYDFFKNREKIKDDFQVNLNKQFGEICYSLIQFLQLRSVDLPNEFEDSIQGTEVKKQDIQKATAELNKVTVEVDTKIKSAEFQKDVAINVAEGEAGAIHQENMAEIDSLKKVQNAQAQAYSNLKKGLGMSNNELLNFIKSKTIKNYKGEGVALNMQTPEITNQK